MNKNPYKQKRPYGSIWLNTDRHMNPGYYVYVGWLIPLPGKGYRRRMRQLEVGEHGVYWKDCIRVA
jgi:hypothetical protein